MSGMRFFSIYIPERVTAFCAVTSEYDLSAILQAMCAKSTVNLNPPPPHFC